MRLRGHLPVAVDLLLNPFDGLGAAEHYQRRVPGLFPRFRAELDRLPFADGQFDIAIFNASFHYSEDYTRTLAEALRCLRRPGKMIIADTPWYTRQQSGEAMLQERRTFFKAMYGFASNSLPSLEFLTDDRLEALEKEFGFCGGTFSIQIMAFSGDCDRSSPGLEDVANLRVSGSTLLRLPSDHSFQPSRYSPEKPTTSPVGTRPRRGS